MSVESDASHMLQAFNYDKYNYKVKTSMKKRSNGTRDKYGRNTMKMTTASTLSPKAP